MRYIATETDKRLLLQRSKKLHVKFELLNADDQVIEEVDGEVLSANLNIDVESEIRRTLDLALFVKDRSYQVSSQSKIWFDKTIRFYVGLYDAQARSVVWYLLGKFIFAENGYEFDAETSTLNLSCLDLMAGLTDARGSQIGASQTVLEVDTDIRAAMIGILDRFTKLTKYSICEFPYDIRTVPYDMEYECGAYPIEMVTALRDLYPCYETFIDPAGVFVCQKIPSRIEDQVVLDASIMDQLIIRESRDHSLSEVKNVTEIWGQSLEADYFAIECASEGITYKAKFAVPNKAYEENKLYGFAADLDSAQDAAFQGDALEAFPILYTYSMSDGSQVTIAIPAGSLKAGYSYVLRYTNKSFILQGELEIHAIVKEVVVLPSHEQQVQDQLDNECRNIRYVVNPDSPFCVEKIGEIRRVCSGDEFDAIYSTQLALERAAYENWKTTRLADRVTLTTIAIPWLDVNVKIEFTSIITGQKNQYLVQGISLDLAQFTMELNLSQFYPYYPF